MVTVSSGSAPEPGRSATSTLWLDGRRRSGTRLRCPTPRPGTACGPGDLATRSRPRCRGQIGSPLSVAASTVGIAGPLFMAELRRSEVSALRWADCPPRGQTHGLPPQSGTVTADHAAQRIAAIGGAGGHDFRAGWRDDGRDPLSVPSPPSAGRRGSREAGATPRPRRRLARPAAPQPPPPAPERSPATAGGTGTDVRGDRPGRSPQVALERHHAAPSCGRGRRGPWQPRRPPPSLRRPTRRRVPVPAGPDQVWER